MARKRPKSGASTLRYQRARQRALYDLQRRHRAEFQQLLEARKAEEGIRFVTYVERVVPPGVVAARIDATVRGTPAGRWRSDRRSEG